MCSFPPFSRQVSRRLTVSHRVGDYIVAINTLEWNDTDGIPNPAYCGKQITVTNTDTNTTCASNISAPSANALTRLRTCRVEGTIWDNSAQANWTAVSRELYLALGGNMATGEFNMAYVRPFTPWVDVTLFALLS